MENDTLSTEGGLTLELLATSIDTCFLLVTTFCIFAMQTGFLLLEAGSVRDHASRTIMLKNICDGCFGAVAWYLMGYSVLNNFSSQKVFLNDVSSFVNFFQSFAFAITTCTIISGGVACRIKFSFYMIYSFIMVAWIYPVVAFWAWDSNGWISARGYKDFAGSGPVHLIGGVSALIGTTFLKPRLHRFEKVLETGEIRDRGIKGHSDKMVILGSMILWCGWFAFNASSSGSITNKESLELTMRAVMNTMIASGAAGVSGVIASQYFLKKQSIGFLMNAILGGLVAITAGCSYVGTSAALGIGAVSPLLTYATSTILPNKFHIDDPLDATAVHGVNGAFGVIVVGLFDMEKGFFITGNADLLGIQVLAVTVMIAWSATFAALYFGLLGKFVQMRVKRDYELMGSDFYYCDGLEFADKLDAFDIMAHNEVEQAKNRVRARGQRELLRRTKSERASLNRSHSAIDIRKTAQVQPMSTLKK